MKGAAGTGPFMIKAFTPFKHIQLVRNPHYYRTGEPCADGVMGDVLCLGQPSPAQR